MNTKIVIYILLFSSLFLGVFSGEVQGRWYNNHSTYYSGNKNCVGDGLGSNNATYGAAAVALNNSTTSLTPHGGTKRELGQSRSGYMRCLQRDGEAPTTYISGITNSWRNVTQTATVQCSDTGGSGCNNSTRQYRILNSGSTCNSSGTWTTGASKVFNSNVDQYICSRVKDIAGNGYSYSTSPVRVRIDKTPPTVSITGISAGWQKTSQTATINCNDTGGSNCNTSSYQFRVTSTTQSCTSSTGGWSNGTTRLFSANTNSYLCARVKDNAGNGYVYSSQVRVQIDKTAPTVSLPYNSVWSDATTPIAFSATDAGGSGLKNVKLEKLTGSITNTSGAVSWGTSWQVVVNRAYALSSSYSQGAMNRKAYKFRVTYEDNAGNIRTYQSSNIIKFDTTTPGDPNIIATDGRLTNQWKVDSTNLTAVINHTGEVSERFNRYCNTSPTCNPNSTTKPNTSTLGNGTHYFRVKTCTQAGRCSGVKTFILKIDNTTPAAPVITADDRSSNEWKNDTTTVLTSTINTSGQFSPRFNKYCMVKSPTTTCDPNSLSKPSTSNLGDGTYYYRVKTCTTSGNCSTVSTFVIKIDTVLPTPTDIGGISPSDNAPLQATDTHNINFVVDNAAGAPISRVEYAVENYNSGSNGYLATQISNDGTVDDTINIQDVDKNREPGKAYREYSLRVTRVCDSAGNCAQNLASPYMKTFIYKVYANTSTLTSGGLKQVDSSDVTDLTDANNVADGTAHDLKIRLEDIYGNVIIPSTDINREVNFEFSAENTLYLNQYNRSGGSAVFMKGTTGAYFQPNIDANADVIIDQLSQDSTNGEYGFDFRLYTPTYQNTWSSLDDKFIINQIDVEISDPEFSDVDTTVTGVPPTGIDFNFQSMYISEFSGDVQMQGFIEGGLQNSSLTTRKNSLSVNTGSSKKLYLRFGGEEVAKLSLEETNIINGLISEGVTLSSLLATDPLFIGSKDLITFLTQNGTINKLEKHYLSSHISYTMVSPISGNLSVVYNSAVVGKDNYHGSYSSDNTRQLGVKIIGKTYSENQTNLTTNQDSEINVLSGDIDKGELKKTIKKNVYDVIKNVNIPSGSSKVLLEGEIIYYKLSGGVLRYSAISSLYKQSGKTIVLEGGDLLIDQNIDITGILGVIVIKNVTDQGGNVYIDNEVSRIRASLYIDKVVYPYTSSFGGRVLEVDDGIGYFKNQLFIYGTFLQNNTLGGSRATPPICPYFIRNTCDLKEAQKYDLNYLRRFFTYDSNADGIDDIIANNGMNYLSSLTYNSNLPWKEYPVIIKYNPLIQTSPPPLFTD